MFGRKKEMLFVGNRSFVVIKAKKPFIDWINSYDEYKIPEEEISRHKTLYMVETIDTESEKEEILKRHFEEIFLRELRSWDAEKSHVPKNLSLELFKEWLEYEFIEICFDTLRGKIDME
jgi:hypothetical protein